MSTRDQFAANNLYLCQHHPTMHTGLGRTGVILSIPANQAKIVTNPSTENLRLSKKTRLPESYYFPYPYRVIKAKCHHKKYILLKARRYTLHYGYMGTLHLRLHFCANRKRYLAHLHAKYLEQLIYIQRIYRKYVAGRVSQSKVRESWKSFPSVVQKAKGCLQNQSRSKKGW